MRFLLEALVSADGCLKRGITNVEIGMPDGSVLFRIIDPKISSWDDDPRLRFQVEFTSDSFEGAAATGKELLSSYLEHISFVSSTALSISRIVRLIDWSEQADQRQCRVFQPFQGPGLPHPVLIPELLETAVMVWAHAREIDLQRAIHWFSSGVRAQSSEDQSSFLVWFRNIVHFA